MRHSPDSELTFQPLFASSQSSAWPPAWDLSCSTSHPHTLPPVLVFLEHSVMIRHPWWEATGSHPSVRCPNGNPTECQTWLVMSPSVPRIQILTSHCPSGCIKPKSLKEFWRCPHVMLGDPSPLNAQRLQPRVVVLGRSEVVFFLFTYRCASVQNLPPNLPCSH